MTNEHSSIKEKSRQLDGLIVEMRGIEPRSEEKTTRISTSIVCSIYFAHDFRSKLSYHKLSQFNFIS